MDRRVAVTAVSPERIRAELGRDRPDSRRGRDSRGGPAGRCRSLASRRVRGLLWRRMPGITRLASYFPRRRLDRALIAKAWGGRAGPGSRSVAAVDEDALTMGVDAALACLSGDDPATVDACYFASTSAPYLEKQVASVVATAVDL